jgi:hypothetical protein
MSVLFLCVCVCPRPFAPCVHVEMRNGGHLWALRRWIPSSSCTLLGGGGDEMSLIWMYGWLWAPFFSSFSKFFFFHSFVLSEYVRTNRYCWRNEFISTRYVRTYVVTISLYHIFYLSSSSRLSVRLSITILYRSIEYNCRYVPNEVYYIDFLNRHKSLARFGQ